MPDTTTDNNQHRIQAASRLSNEGRKFFNLIEFDSTEELVTEIRKHPIGLMFIFVSGGLVSLVLLFLAGLSASINMESLVGDASSSVRLILGLMFFLLFIGTVVATLISAWLYKSNVIFLTSEKIAQVLYVSLFNRKVSQLSIGDVQDVTVGQKGILAHMFNYGTLVIETAGEQSNYSFNYVPDPYVVSKQIVGAHEENLAKFGN